MTKIPPLPEPQYHASKFVSKRPAHAGRFAELLILGNYLFWLTKVNKIKHNYMTTKTLLAHNIYSRLMISGQYLTIWVGYLTIYHPTYQPITLLTY